jgi:hypothetical protein
VGSSRRNVTVAGRACALRILGWNELRGVEIRDQIEIGCGVVGATNGEGERGASRRAAGEGMKEKETCRLTQLVSEEIAHMRHVK